MFDQLPVLFDPREFVEKKRRIEGSIPLASLDRVRDVLLSQEGKVDVLLEFGQEGRVAAICGRVETSLVLQCQRCLEVLIWPVYSEVRLGVVGSLDEAGALPEEFEPMVVAPGDTGVAPADIVQDELLLAIPSIPRHPECRMPRAEVSSKHVDHPFAGLAQLKKNKS